MNIWFCRLPVVALVPIVVNKFQKIYQMKFSLKYQSWSLLPLRMCCALLLTNAVVSWLADHCSHSSTRTAESNEKWRRIWSQWEKIEKISLGNVLIYKDIHVHVILNWQGLVCNQNVTRFFRNGYMYLFLLFVFWIRLINKWIKKYSYLIYFFPTTTAHWLRFSTQNFKYKTGYSWETCHKIIDHRATKISQKTERQFSQISSPLGQVYP